MVTIANPTLLIGLGAFGVEVVGAVRAEGRRLDDLLDSRGLANLQALSIAETLGDGEPLPDLIAVPGPIEDTDTVADAVRDRVRGLLKLRHLLDHGERSRRGPPRLDVFVVAALSDPRVRRDLAALLHLIEDLITREFSPIFEAYRDGDNTNFALIPLLMTPHPPSSPDGAAIRDLLLHLETRHNARATPDIIVRQVYLVEDVSGHYLLDPDDLADMFATFLNFLLYSNLRSEPEFRQLYQRSRVGDLFATFTCATLEFPLALVLDYAAGRLALELLEHFSSTTTLLPTPRRAALEAWFDPLIDRAVSGAQARATTRAAMETAQPEVFAPFPLVEQLAEPAALRATFTPDWLARRLDPWRTHERAWTTARLDDATATLERDTNALVKERTAQLLDEHDALLHGRTDRAHLHELADALADLQRRLQTHLDVTAPPEPEPEPDPEPPAAPDFTALEALYADFVAALADLVSPRKLAAIALVGGVALTTLIVAGVVTLPTIVIGLALLGAAATLASSLAVYLGKQGLKWYKAIDHVRAFTGASTDKGSLARAWDTALAGDGNSVLTKLAAEVERRHNAAVHNALSTAIDAVHAEHQRLTTLLHTLEAQTIIFHDRQIRLGVVYDLTGRELRSAALSTDGVFRRFLIDQDDLDLLYRSRCRTTDIETLSRKLRTEDDLFDTWRQTTPLESEPALAALAQAQLATGLTHQSVFALPELAKRVDQRLTAFFADFADTLELHLNFTGHEAADATGIVHHAHRLVLVAEAGHAPVLEARAAAGAHHWQVRSKMVDPNRVHLLRVASDIHSSAIRSLAPHLFPQPEPTITPEPTLTPEPIPPEDDADRIVPLRPRSSHST